MATITELATVQEKLLQLVDKHDNQYGDMREKERQMNEIHSSIQSTLDDLTIGN